MGKDLVIIGSKNRPVRVKVYDATDPVAVVVVVHGMQEHSLRYEDFAKELTNRNITVWVSDLRGHGDNIVSRPGLDDGNIFENIVDDQKAIIEKAKKDYKTLPVVVYGHSYGSFVTQRLIRDRVPADKFVLSGSTFMKGILYALGGLVSKISLVFKGREADANLIEKMSIRGYGKGFENGNWLTRDDSVWEKYLLDPKCGQVFPVAFYMSMFSCIPKNYTRLKNAVGYAPKILLVAGDRDPVGNFGKGVDKLEKVYLDAGFDVKKIIYPDCRHEMHNEINKSELFDDVEDFVKNC